MSNRKKLHETIPTKLSDLQSDSQHETVNDAEKTNMDDMSLEGYTGSITVYDGKNTHILTVNKGIITNVS